VARRNLLESTSPADNQGPGPITPDGYHLSVVFTLTPLIVILFLSLGLWWLVWNVLRTDV
jgi:hypothetical protein